MKKHAYLILAHNKLVILEKLIKLLDDKRNDIYIHIDKDVKNIDYKKYTNMVNYSKVVFIENRISVHWGAYSLVKAELLLLKEAFSNKYEYYHILSGVDLPLKSQDYIHDFFDKNKGKEFVQFFCENQQIKRKYINRYKYNHFFQEFAYGKKSRAILKIIRIVSELCQELLGIDRISKNDKILQIGSNWISITHDFNGYILENEDWIHKTYKNSLCADESFVQTLLYNSKFIKNNYYNKFDNNYLACMRYIDWKRGRPYVWTKNEFRELIESPFLFARKFDDLIDKEIIEMIYEKIYNDKMQS